MPAYSGAVAGGIPPGLRLDRYVAEYLGLLTRSQIKARSLEARVNGRAVKISRPLEGGELLELSWQAAEPAELIPEDLPLEIIYEDNRVVVVNKAQGMVVHPGAGNYRGTLANALLYRRLCRAVAGTNPAEPGRTVGSPASLRPGIVHRLDKDTSGVIIAAWDEEAHAFLAEQFKSRRVRKIYAAIVKGSPREKTGRIENRLIRDSRDRKRFTVASGGNAAGSNTAAGNIVDNSPGKGRISCTLYRVIHSWGSHSLLLLRPRTGRTHQLRVHMRYLGHPILGDPIYGAPDPLKRPALMLHAKSLSIILPNGEGQTTFKAPLPARFREFFEAPGR